MNKQLASLLFYNETLYASPKIQITEEEKKTDAPVFTKKVVILLDELSEEERQLLGNILKAINLNFKEVESYKQAIDFKDVTSATTVKLILSFGDLLQNLDKDKYPLYKPVVISNQTFLFADSVEQINVNADNEKTKLWKALQQMFLQ